MTTAELASAEQTFAAPKTKWLVQYKWAFGLSVVLAAATILLYLPVIHHPFANLDDQGYVYENLHVQDGLTWPMLKWALTTLDDNNWHPLTWVAHATDCQLFGIDPAGHHMMAAVWHTADALVLFWVCCLRRDTSAAASWWRPCSPCIPSTLSPWPGWPSGRPW